MLQRGENLTAMAKSEEVQDKIVSRKLEQEPETLERRGLKKTVEYETACGKSARPLKKHSPNLRKGRCSKKKQKGYPVLSGRGLGRNRNPGFWARTRGRRKENHNFDQ